MRTAHARNVLLLAALLVIWSCDRPLVDPVVPQFFHADDDADAGADDDADSDSDDDEDSDSDDDADSDDAGHSRAPALRPIAKFKQRPAPPNPLNDHMMIGPNGGTLRVGEFEIIVPAGAVDRAVNFRIRRPVDPRAAEHAYAEFSPHITFRKPVTIRLPHRSTNAADKPHIGWWSGERWVVLPTRTTGDGRIEADVSHFSYYGTLLWSKGITTLGG